MGNGIINSSSGLPQRGQTQRTKCLPESLAQALTTPTRLVFSEDDTHGDKVVVRDVPWQPPARITAADVVGARRWLEAFRMEDGRVQAGVLEQWLASLCAGLNHAMTVDALKLRVKALVFAVADRPSFCFTEDTLRLAQAQFTFVPIAKELIGFAAEIERSERENARRLMTVVDRGVQEPKRSDDPNWTPGPDPMRRQRDPLELKAVGDICARIRITLAEADLDRHAARKPAPQKEAAE
jgi:hypothetical protein